MKKINLALALGSALGLSACFTDSDSSPAAKSMGILPPVDELLADLPSSVAGGGTTSLARLADGAIAVGDTSFEAKVVEPYKPALAYIHLANAVKNQVKAVVKNFESANIPEQVDTTINGWHVISKTADTTVDGANQKIFKVTFDSAGVKNLGLNYWKNARDQYRGNFYLRSSEGLVALHFNNHNEALFGKRMVVVFHRPQEKLNAATDPSVLKVVAVRKNDKVWVSGASYHPTWKDDGNFWVAGPRLYGFKAAVNSVKDVGLFSVAFATPTEAKNGGLFQDSLLLDQAVARQALPMVQANAGLVTWINLVMGTSKAADQLTVADLQAFSRKALANPNTLTGEQKAFLALMAIPQPVVVKAGARIAGAVTDVQSDVDAAALQVSDLKAAEIETPDVTEITTVNMDYQLPDGLIK